MPPQATSRNNRGACSNSNNNATDGNADVPAIDLDGLLASLNPAQHQAVTHDPKIPLQILAGPGSGKTKVLTSRIAHLILVHKVAPSSICAVTFTNKAANEMRERLNKLIGKSRTTALQMGTFHSICVRYLRMHSSVVGLEDNFTICDSDESKKLVMALMKPYKDYIIENDIAITEGSILSKISAAKAKGQSAAEFLKDVNEMERANRNNPRMPNQRLEGYKSFERILAEIYIAYEEVLKNNNALDFDDLLVYGVKLFGTHEQAVLWCRHVLVDEFQDTNTMQYQLMRCLGVRRCVSIVGDPDQSIYGWRSAEVTNLAKMRKDFPNTRQIYLERNYRSSGAILRTSLAIVEEDKKRIPKSLHTSHPLGTTPFLGVTANEKDESEMIAFEIKRSVAYMGGVLKWGDFAILLRFNALSRPIESALQKNGIPCRILGGHKFFERMEVKDIIAYLQLLDNPGFNPAFVRAIKAPSRGVGDKSLEEISLGAERSKNSQLKLVEKIVDNKTPDTKPPVKKKVTPFVKVFKALRRFNEEETLPSEIIRKLVNLIGYEDHLKKTQQDWESRWENVQELITFASEIEAEMIARETNVPEAQAGPDAPAKQSKLRHFLQCSTLSSAGDNESEEQNKEKVTISTCHAAKGLEWPVVIVPAVDSEIFPFYRTDDIEEERRLLYVACTRAQSLLYLLYSSKRQVAGKAKDKGLSPFVSVPLEKNPGLFSQTVPQFRANDRAVICQVLSRELPDEAEIQRRVKELEESREFVQPTPQTPSGQMATVALDGTRSSVLNVPVGAGGLSSMYASPSALAAISASFTRDYNPKVPFGKPPASFQRPGMSAFVPMSELYSSAALTVQLPVGHQSVPTPRTHMTNLTSFRQDVLPNAVSEKSRPERPRSFFDMSQAQTATSSKTYLSQPASINGANGTSRLMSSTGSSSKTNRPKNTPMTVDIDLTRSSSPPQYDENHPPGEPSSRLNPVLLDQDPRKRFSSLPNSPANISSTNSSQLDVASSPARTPSSRLPVVTNLPSVATVPPRTQPSPMKQGSSTTENVAQTTGVKRRLGMGRGYTGYSNKKFKPLM
ncbi:P-loop containing nucleoside triphosphate hydrolase protein [Crepidotus variabilis]|uniref:DNA 3'-5' helicase n=1 Tax=Crepidotus variabilis TaxID=179855 RepID=A0A9P6ENT5_9AGAR|nr:P-loop containing nucleoside triphosphate hydrolase protein [Crepidotus variabilis]